MKASGQPRHETDEHRADYARRYRERVELAMALISRVAGRNTNAVEVLFRHGQAFHRKVTERSPIKS